MENIVNREKNLEEKTDMLYSMSLVYVELALTRPELELCLLSITIMPPRASGFADLGPKRVGVDSGP